MARVHMIISESETTNWSGSDCGHLLVVVPPGEGGVAPEGPASGEEGERGRREEGEGGFRQRVLWVAC